jgi:DNA-binding transcriptional LysR family regulator
MLGIDTRLLESFVVLGEELHFTRAAERLHVAQPALSQQIARLERQLGIRLFTRTPVALTAPGQALFDRARPALHELWSAIDEARRISTGTSGTVRLGHLSSFGTHVVPALVAALRDRGGELELTAREHSGEEQLERLHARTLDVGFFYVDRDLDLGDPAVTLSPLASGPLYVMVPDGHRLAGERILELEAFASEAWIEPTGTDTSGYQSRSFHALCRRHGFAPEVTARANSFEAMLGMVAAGLGVATAPWTIALRPRPGIVLVETPDETFDAVAATLTPGTAARLIDVARDVLTELALSVAPTAR